MAYKLPTRTKESSSIAGTGAVTVLGAVLGFRALAATLAVSDTSTVAIVDALGNWEIVRITMTGASTFTRDTVIASSNANALVNFPAGDKQVFVIWPSPETAGSLADLRSILAISMLPSSYTPTVVGESGWECNDAQLTFKRMVTGGAIKGSRWDLETLI